jgi:glutamate formiminotransferase
VLECVVNVSEGRRPSVIASMADACGPALLDVHADPHHNRSVFTLVGEEAPRLLATAAVGALDLRRHEGAHPRIGVVDVVPFVALSPGVDARAARDAFAAWAASVLQVPVFLYGPERTLPDVRRRAFGELAPDLGPSSPHPTAGAMAVGVRGVLVAWNLWLAPGVDVAEAKRLAASVRRRWPGVVRALGLAMGGQAQVSCNLVAPLTVGPGDVYDLVAATGAPIDHAELVGLAPQAVLDAAGSERWERLGLSPEATIEARLRPRPTL